MPKSKNIAAVGGLAFFNIVDGFSIILTVLIEKLNYMRSLQNGYYQQQPCYHKVFLKRSSAKEMSKKMYTAADSEKAEWQRKEKVSFENKHGVGQDINREGHNNYDNGQHAKSGVFFN